jgi:hypothetical protein
MCIHAFSIMGGPGVEKIGTRGLLAGNVEQLQGDSFE